MAIKDSQINWRNFRPLQLGVKNVRFHDQRFPAKWTFVQGDSFRSENFLETIGVDTVTTSAAWQEICGEDVPVTNFAIFVIRQIGQVF